MNLRPALRFLGRLIVLLASTELVPAACALIYGETSDALAFAGSAALTGTFGLLLMWWGRDSGEIYRREGILIVVGGWVLASLFGALPYLLTETFTHPVDALFESASGFTTTGASVMTDIESFGRGVLFWRSFTQWLGGMGIIVLFVALLPELGPGARFLYQLEVPGPSAEALQPRIRETAGILWKIYLVFTGAQTGLLMLVGLDLYDALTHTFATMSTGGFSPRNQSVAAFESPWVQVVIIFFMIAAGTNFSLYYRMREPGGWNLFRNTEFRLYVLFLVGAATLVAVDLIAHETEVGAEGVVLSSLFQVTSLQTTTGFATADFDGWPTLSRMILVALMFVGGCAGSTSGSMKIMRMVIGIKTALREVKLIFSPNSVLGIFVGGRPVPDQVARSVAGFFILYLSTWALGAGLLAISAPDLVTAATAAAATLGNIGPGLAAVGPKLNFALFEAWEKLLMVALMLLGRLEMYAIAALFARSFWKP